MRNTKRSLKKCMALCAVLRNALSESASLPERKELLTRPFELLDLMEFTLLKELYEYGRPITSEWVATVLQAALNGVCTTPFTMALKRCTELKAELNLLDERARFMRTFELLDMLEQTLVEAEEEWKAREEFFTQEETGRMLRGIYEGEHGEHEELLTQEETDALIKEGMSGQVPPLTDEEIKALKEGMGDKGDSLTDKETRIFLGAYEGPSPFISRKQ
jgi:hypothetical protein